jgi:hypothetical protein
MQTRPFFASSSERQGFDADLINRSSEKYINAAAASFPVCRGLRRRTNLSPAGNGRFLVLENCRDLLGLSRAAL